MEWFAAPEHALGRWVLLRGLGAVYVIAFVGAVNQFRPLLGEEGLLPVPAFLDRVSVRDRPSLFHWRYSDRLALAVAWTGVVLAAAVVAGIPQAGPVWAHMLVWAALFCLYLSIVNVGQIWYAFGWESITLEAGFLAIFLGSDAVAPPLLAVLLVKWLLFRVEFGAGLIKLRGDDCWRELTCLYYHHETQPLPSPLSWFAHHLPKPLHRVEVAANHVAQLAVPFGLFAPQPIASVAAAIIIVTQLWLMLSGNFAWLNAITIVLATVALDAAWLDPVLPEVAVTTEAGPLWFVVAVFAAFVAFVVMSWWPVRNMASRHQRMNASFNSLHLCNTYGAFGSVTRTRHEIVLEATRGEDPEAAEWEPYRFKGKPTDPARWPPQIAPYHLRLDWLMWFAAMRPRPAQPWFHALVDALLSVDEDVLGLLAEAPFGDEAPTFVRARRFRYRFTTPAERRETGAVWVREETGTFLDPVATPGRGITTRWRR